jgi:hypothetical protein
MERRSEALVCWMLLIAGLIAVASWCLLPPRHSDGRLADAVAREMYDANLDEPLKGGGYEDR